MQKKHESEQAAFYVSKSNKTNLLKQCKQKAIATKIMQNNPTRTQIMMEASRQGLVEESSLGLTDKIRCTIADGCVVVVEGRIEF